MIQWTIVISERILLESQHIQSYRISETIRSIIIYQNSRCERVNVSCQAHKMVNGNFVKMIEWMKIVWEIFLISRTNETHTATKHRQLYKTEWSTESMLE